MFISRVLGIFEEIGNDTGDDDGDRDEDEGRYVFFLSHVRLIPDLFTSLVHLSHPSLSGAAASVAAAWNRATARRRRRREVAECSGNERSGLVLSTDSELCLESVVIGYISSDWDKLLLFAVRNRLSKERPMCKFSVQDGKLRVFKWPGMEAVIDEEQAHSTVNDLDFSLDGKFLIYVGGGGPCRVWDMTSLKGLASFPDL
ncbi:hypothetical protein Dimus_003535 [Dionaea muscipula]